MIGPPLTQPPPSFPPPPGRAAGRRLFAGTVWGLLAIILAWALLPAGLPEREAVGSAFSPANLSVALRGHARQSVAAAQRPARPDAGEPPASSGSRRPVQAEGVLIGIMAVLLCLGACGRSGNCRSRARAAARFRPKGASRPRAPPRLS